MPLFVWWWLTRLGITSPDQFTRHIEGQAAKYADIANALAYVRWAGNASPVEDVPRVAKLVTYTVGFTSITNVWGWLDAHLSYVPDIPTLLAPLVLL